MNDLIVFKKFPLIFYISLFINSLFISMSLVQNLYAVEPEKKLFSEQVTERNNAYKEKAQLLEEKISSVTDDKEKTGLLVQQQLLNKLAKLPDKPEKPSMDLRFSRVDLPKKLSWKEIEQFLGRYISIVEEAKIADQNLENTSKLMQDLYNRLIALGDTAPDQDILQLQYAFQNRIFIQQTEIEKQLKEGLETAKELYPEVLRSINITKEMLEEQELKRDKAKITLQDLEEEQILSAAGDDISIQQQESLLAGYLGRELTDNEKKEMHYEQLKLLRLQVQQLHKNDTILDATVAFLEEGQKTAWFLLFNPDPDFFKISDLSGDISSQVVLLRRKTDRAHGLIYTYEKELSTLRGGNALVGPKAQELINGLDKMVQTVFTLLSGIEQRAELIENKGKLLEKAIDLKQSAIGSMITKIREVTDHFLEKAIHVLKYPLLSYSGMNISLLLLLQVVVLLILGIIVNRLYGHLVRRMGSKRNWSEQTIHLVQATGKYPFIFIVAMILLSVVGINTRSLALVAGALSVGIGFGMQTIVNNLVSGIILLFDKSIRPGDFICLGENSSTGGFRGSVVQMNIRATVLRTNDNINIIIPNADLMASQVVNWTYADEQVRFRIPFSVAYGTDIDQVKSIVKKAVVDLPVVLTEPEPQIWLASHADSSLAFLAAIWVEGLNARKPARITDTVLTTIYKTLVQNGIEIPVPQLDLRLRDIKPRDNDFVSITEKMQLKMYKEAAAPQ